MLRLFCFPYAGIGASAYREWPSGLPQHVELWGVQPPGRETRMTEPAFSDMNALVAAVTGEIVPHLTRPYALFGHSMGAVVAFETARRLRAVGAPEPVRLIVSGRRAPHLPDPEPPLHALPDDRFIAELQRRYGGIPAQVLEHRDLLALLLPGLRADLTALERHDHVSGEPLGCPITAFGGTDDPRAGRSELEGWAEHTGGAVTVRQFPGGHFYLQDARQPLLDAIAVALHQATAGQQLAEARA